MLAGAEAYGEEVAVLRAEAGDDVAALLHFTSHPDHKVPRRTICGGWPGAPPGGRPTS